MLDELITQLSNGVEFSDEQVAVAVSQLIDEKVAAESKADFLTALSTKVETPNEIAAFARELRGLSLQPPLDDETRHREILDVCGTGGDRLNTFNISTTVAIIAAAGGVTVAKHGNRAITSQSGSADVLEELGIPIDLSPQEAADSLRDLGFAFFFAPKFHPAFKHIGPARKLCSERGQRTIFNYLGPLLNPARPSAQLIGVPQPQLCGTIARVLQSLGARRGMVVCGHAGESSLDELSTMGETDIAEFYQDRGFSISKLSHSDFGFQPATLKDWVGGDRRTNARIIHDLLSGRDTGPKRDAVLLNAGAALFVAGKSRSILEGINLASHLIDSGQARAKLEELAKLGSKVRS